MCTEDCTSISILQNVQSLKKEDGADVNGSQMQAIVIQSAPFLQVKHSAQTTVYSVCILKMAMMSM